MKKIACALCTSLLLNASELLTTNSSLSLESAISILKSQNLEIKTASYDIDSAKEDQKTVDGLHWGKLDFIQDYAHSNDAGNVFGFKLTSREATFGDFGAREFMTATGMNGGIPPESAYTTPPEDLNYPDARSFFQSKLKYEIPLFTGFKISSYSEIMKAMTQMKNLDKNKIVKEKVYQLRKSFYDMALLRDSKEHLTKILDNIKTLEEMTKTMIEVGYAKKVDLLEVQAKKGDVERVISQIDSNQKLLYHYISFLLNQDVKMILTPCPDVEMPILSNENILQNNIDIQRAKTGLKIRDNMLKVSQSAYYPMVGAFGEISTADDTFLGDASDHKAYTVGARVSWNLYNGGIDEANIEKAKIQQLKTTTQLELAKQGILLKIRKIRTEIATLNGDIESLNKEFKLANAIYENYEGRYKEKLVSMSDVIIKQSQQIQKILELQQVKNSRNKRIFALEKLANGENNEK